MMLMHMMLGLAAAAQAAPEQAPPQPAKATAEPCPARQFETVVAIEVEGRTRRSRIRMCGKEGQTDSEWLRTLQDGADRIAADPKMPQSAKDQALAAIAAEIARLAPVAPAPAPTPVLADIGDPFARPPSPRPPVKLEPSLAATYSALPPLAPQAPAPAVPSASRPLPMVPMVSLRLSLECMTPKDLGIGIAGQCLALERDTILLLRARDSLPAGGWLRFARDGDERARIALPAIARGKSAQFRLPAEVCENRRGQIELEIVRRPPGSTSAPGVVASLGDYQLRC